MTKHCQDYFESVIIPNACYEIFIDFILEQTSQAIEESTIKDFLKSAKSPHTEPPCPIDNLFTLHNTKFFLSLESQAIIVRLEQDPKNLIENLKSFSLILSQRLSQEVGFAYSTTQKSNTDWIATYQKSITPIECARFYIRPSWHSPKPNLENIIIDPALAFGSGHHASTLMCIEFLQNLNLQGQNALDVGCGSGILGIVMAKLGGCVDMCDVDDLAIQETQKNCALNHIAYNHIWQGSIESTTQKYNIICANILADVIISLHNDFKRILCDSGILILSGIIDTKAQDVIECFKDFTLQETRTKDEWVSLKLALDNS